MDDERTLHSKPRAVHKLMDYYSCEESRPWLNTSDSDTSQSDSNNRSPVPSCALRGYSSPCKLPPIGVFWDIENCQIPRGRSAVAVSQAIRDKFFDGYREAEFLVVCDVKKETSQVIQELNDAQVNLIHVGSQSKNAADEKLRQSIRRFADLHGSMAAIVLISGDINFAPDLCDLRHRKKIHVILVHNDMCSESLMLCANEHYRFSDLVASLPFRGAIKSVSQPAQVTVSSLPVSSDPRKVRMRLRQLAENCGGRVGVVLGELATIRFPSIDFAIRAQRRMDGEKVFGSQISVSYPTIVRETPTHGSPLKGLNTNNRGPPEWGQWTGQGQGHSSPPPPISQGTGPYRRANITPSKAYYNQENIPTRKNYSELQHKSVGARPILGRGTESSGRHSLDSHLTDERQPSDKTGRMCRTPSPPSVQVNTSMPPPPIVNLPRSTDNQFMFQPIAQRPGRPSPVEVVVTQLDRTIGLLDIKRQLTAAFKQHLPVVSVTVFVRPNNILAASIKLVSQNDAARAISLLQGHRIGASQIHIHLPEPGYCVLHSLGPRVNGAGPMVWVNVRLVDFSNKLTQLITSHDNHLPLNSLVDCYTSQYECLAIGKAEDGCSVPLEQLVSWVPAVHVEPSPAGKVLRLITPDQERQEQTGKEADVGQELVVLLRLQPRCETPLAHLAPLYQHHFGRQLTGGDNLLDVLLQLSHYVQVVGEGPDQLVTLAPRAQLQRFTVDLLRVLRAQNNQRLALTALPAAWKIITGQVLSATDYGLCHLDDLIGLVSSADVTVSGDGPQRTLAIPRPTHTTSTQEIKLFANQVVTLLSQTPHFSLELSKFIPFYNQHFGTQCCVADYGFSKLSDLFKAIPRVVQLEGGEVSLTLAERLKVLASQVAVLVQPRMPDGLRLDNVNSAYLWQFGHALKPATFQCTSLAQLIAKLPNIKVTTGSEGYPLLTLADNTECLRVLRILWDRSSAKMSLSEFYKLFEQNYDSSITLQSLQNQLKQVVKVTEEGQIQLRPLQLFARDVYRLLCAHDGRLALNVFEAEFRRTLGTAVSPHQYGYSSPSELLASIDHVVTLTGRSPKRIITLNPRLADVGICLPSELVKNGKQNNSSNSKKPVVNRNVDPAKTKVQGGDLELVLMSPADMLLPRASLSFHPPPPDPSTLPRPGNLLIQPQGSPNGDEDDLNDLGKRKLRLAAHFPIQPIQLK